MSFIAPKSPKAPEVNQEKTAIVPPVAPIEDTSLEIGSDKDVKKKSGRAGLKIPLVDTSKTGLKV